MAAQNAECLAILRPMERSDLLGIEVGNLATWGTIERLNPEVNRKLAYEKSQQQLSLLRQLRNGRNEARGHVEVVVSPTAVGP